MPPYLVALAVALAAGAVVDIWRGYVVSILWAWFAVPVFGLPPLGVAAAIGISLVVGLLTYQPVPPDAWEGKSFDFYFSIFATSLLALAVGWIAKQFLA